MAKRIAWGLTIWLAAASWAGAGRYVDSNNATGTTPFGAYEGVAENVDLRNLNLNVVIPLFELKGRNGLDYPVVAAYNSTYNVWKPKEDPYVPPYYELERIEGTDVRFTVRPGPALTYKDEAYPQGGIWWHTNRYILHEIDGTRREFGAAPHASDVTHAQWMQAETFRATDSSHMKLVELVDKEQVRVYRKDGTQMHFSAPVYAGIFRLDWIRDTNGNKITFAYDPFIVTDTLGREVRFANTAGGGDLEVRVERSAGGGELLYVLTADRSQLRLPGGATNPALRYGLAWSEFGPATRRVSATLPTGPRSSWGRSFIRPRG
jgi:hypothetical protein